MRWFVSSEIDNCLDSQFGHFQWRNCQFLRIIWSGSLFISIPEALLPSCGSFLALLSVILASHFNYFFTGSFTGDCCIFSLLLPILHWYQITHLHNFRGITSTTTFTIYLLVKFQFQFQFITTRAVTQQMVFYPWQGCYCLSRRLDAYCIFDAIPEIYMRTDEGHNAKCKKVWP